MNTRFLPHILLLLFCLFALLFSSCASSRLSNMWRDSSYNSGTMNSMLVIAVKKNPTLRRVWEDGFSNELAKHGVTATPSYRLFPGDLPDTAQVINAIKEKNYNGVLIVSRLESQTNTTYVPGYIQTKPVFRYDRMHNEYYTRYEHEYHPGFTDSSTIIRHEVNVWTTKEGGRMVWSGTGDVLDPGSSKAVNDEIVTLVVPELASGGIIPAEIKK